MTQQNHLDTVETDPAQAFNHLRGEIVRLSRLVDHLGSVPDRTPNYSPTLADMTQALKSIRDALIRIEQSPGVKTTHEAVHEKIVELSQVIRAEDRRMIVDAHETIMQSVGRIDAIVERGQAADRQGRQRRWRDTGFLVGGILIWSILPGTVARSLPESWHVPESMASSMMGRDMKAAGERLQLIAGRLEAHPPVATEPAPKQENTTPAARRKSRH